ncbi:MAG: proliferating cell nuclear antigen (pcna) [Thermodesulfobacteriota bacterium]|nr:proliferating cell nuclear antigen (pcna) [Thermodesulfobacteriota bacterium]
MFELKFDDAKVFKEIVEAISTLIDEGEFEILNEGMKLRAMDPSQIAMVDFEISKDAFEKYEIPSETKIGLNLEDLSRITSRVRAGESLTLKLDDTKARLELVFQGKSTRRFNLPLLDISSSSPKTPSIDFDAKIKVNGPVIKESLKDASLVSSHVVLNATENGFDVKAHGDKGDVTVETLKDQDILLEHTVNKNSKAMFPLEYLNDLLKATDSASIVEINLGTDKPLKVEYNLGQARLTYFLAPRIETE